MNVGIFLPNWLGDLVMATPTLRALRRHFGPEVRIAGIVRPYLADVLAGTGWLDELWPFDPRAGQPELRRWALIRRMRRQRLDVVLLLTNSLHTAVLAWLGGAKERIGYVRYGRGPLLTKKLYLPREHSRRAGSPMVDYYLKLADLIGCPPESPRLELATTEADERSARRVWESLGLRADGRVVLLNSSGAYGPSKWWPTGHFALLARRLAAELDHDAVMMCGPAEREMAREVVRLAGHPRVFSMADQPLDFGTTKACIRRGRLMVSTDSGPRHIAAALGKPLVTLYGAMLPVWGENPTVHSVDLCLDLPCIGCHNRDCPLGHHQCMEDLTVDMVYAAAAKLVDGGRALRDVA